MHDTTDERPRIRKRPELVAGRSPAGSARPIRPRRTLASPSVAPPATGSVHPQRALELRPLLGLLLAIVAVALVARALLAAHGASAPANSGAPGAGAAAAPQVGHPAPDAVFLDLANQHVPLSSFRGKVVVMNFWYAACEPCKYEMPALQRTYDADKGRGLVIVGVDISDDTPTINEFVRQIGISYPILRDLGGRTAIAYGVVFTPSSFILDRHGVIRYKVVGPVNAPALNADVNALLARG